MNNSLFDSQTPTIQIDKAIADIHLISSSEKIPIVNRPLVVVFLDSNTHMVIGVKAELEPDMLKINPLNSCHL